MKKFLITFLIIALYKPTSLAQCPNGASGFEVRNSTCSGGCAVLLQGWPAGVIVNIFSASPIDSIGSSGIIPSSGTAFVCIPCHTDLIFASFVPGAQNGCVILVNTILAVTINSFTVTASGGSPLLKWDISSEASSVSYIVQRSIDGKIFNDITTVNGNATGGISKTYSYSDINAGQGALYYRLKISDVAGSIKYSSTVSIYNQPDLGIKIFPTLVTGHNFKINIPVKLLPAIVTITDAQGRSVYTDKLTQTSSTINTSLRRGIYALKVIGNNNITITQKIIKQ